MSKNTQQLSPEVILKRYYAAMNTGQADVAYALFAAEAVRREQFISAADLIVTGPERIEAGIKARIEDNIVVEAWDFQAEGNKVTCMARISTDYGRQVGYAPIEERVAVIVVHGKIKDFTVAVTPESYSRMEAAEEKYFRN